MHRHHVLDHPRPLGEKAEAELAGARGDLDVAGGSAAAVIAAAVALPAVGEELVLFGRVDAALCLGEREVEGMIRLCVDLLAVLAREVEDWEGGRVRPDRGQGGRLAKPA